MKVETANEGMTDIAVGHDPGDTPSVVENKGDACSVRIDYPQGSEDRCIVLHGKSTEFGAQASIARPTQGDTGPPNVCQAAKRRTKSQSVLEMAHPDFRD